MYHINIKSTTKPTIVKFEANKFLTKHENFEFHNIDEAERSPLAQELFHLDFVKTIYIAQNFIALEKYNIVHWKDVQQKVADKIESFLNEGGLVVNSSEEDKTKRIPVTVYAESTPNPNTMKFVSNKKLVLQPAEFKNNEATENAPLAKALFQLPFVKEVFFDENYISIQKTPLAQWEEITNELREFLRVYLEEGKDVLDDDVVIPEPKKDDIKVSEENIPEPKVYDSISKEIMAILEEYIRPAVASDGGNIYFESYNADDKVVKVVLQGACSGCPSSSITLKNGIETMLKEMLQDKVSRVEAING